jgi:hypothetical protein
MDNRYTGLAGELEGLAAAIKGALEGIGLVRPLVSIIPANGTGSGNSGRSLSPAARFRRVFGRIP